MEHEQHNRRVYDEGNQTAVQWSDKQILAYAMKEFADDARKCTCGHRMHEHADAFDGEEWYHPCAQCFRCDDFSAPERYEQGIPKQSQLIACVILLGSAVFSFWLIGTALGTW